MSYTKKIIAKNLKAIVTERKISVYDLAEQAGMSHQALYLVLDAKSGISAENLYNLANALGVSMDYLCGKNLEHDMNECIRRVSVAAKRGSNG